MADLSAALDAFLRAASGQKFDWGVADCCLFPADWLVALGWPDPAAAWRGRYRTARGAQTVLRGLGGVEGAVASGALTAGLSRTSAPMAGDVGVIMAEAGRGLEPVGAICLGRRWAVRGAMGLVVLAVAPRAAWRV